MKNESFSANSPDIERSKMTYFIICLIGFTQGILELSNLSISYLYKDDFLLDPFQMSIAAGITTIPWVIKPLWGYISDSYHIFGYRRKSYLVFLSFVNCIIWLILTFLAHNVYFAVFLLLGIEICNAFCNVIGEAILVEISRDPPPAVENQKENEIDGKIQSEEEKKIENSKQSIASNNVSLFFGVRYTGIVITAYLSGVLLEYIDKRDIFLITSSFPFILCISAIFLSERKSITINKEENENLANNEENELLNDDNNNNQQQQQENGADKDKKNKCSDNCKANCPNCNRLWNFIKHKEILKPIIFLLAFNSIPSGSAALFFFYTNALKFNSEFMGELKVISALSSVIAVMIYRSFLKLCKFKSIFVSTAILVIISQLLLLILITRTNLVLGINDKVFSIFDNLFMRMMAELNGIPVLVFACRICPKNIEGTMYALIMSTLNLGNMLSDQIGGFFIYVLGITSTDFKHLWILIVIENMFTVLLLPFLYFLKINEAQEIAEGEKKVKNEEDKQNNNNNINKNNEEAQNHTISIENHQVEDEEKKEESDKTDALSDKKEN